MMRFASLAAAILIPLPAFAAEGPFVTLNNTDFVVLLGFLVFIGVLLYLRVPTTLFAMLDKRSDSIRSDLAEARELREEAQSLLASYERKQKDVQNQADRIVASAREDAKQNAAKAEAEMQKSMERRVQAAKEQIASAEEQAIRDVRDRAITVAIAAAHDVLKGRMDPSRQNALIEQSIKTVDAKLH
ncbi:F0F1 ATP synthase subunit B [Palleronia sp. LCG004]|uniref:F0F1 ATP synthase subunit B n=1 Tax=Palleronia sp. LCG004 TaxID=3079304 RepID=UPI00294273E7|nr:F0F1 ATP synthase subunit B [Palleronia sp. LCG004]WOI55059.1 F0F1 ATP synthase subunit B [Palleronia sp. LCG004]